PMPAETPILARAGRGKVKRIEKRRSCVFRIRALVRRPSSARDDDRSCLHTRRQEGIGRRITRWYSARVRIPLLVALGLVAACAVAPEPEPPEPAAAPEPAGPPALDPPRQLRAVSERIRWGDTLAG